MELAGAVDTQFIGQDAGKVLVVATNVFLLCSWFPSLQIASTGVVWHGETFYDSAVTPEKNATKILLIFVWILLI
jgi:hypothetical protein